MGDDTPAFDGEDWTMIFPLKVVSLKNKFDVFKVFSTRTFPGSWASKTFSMGHPVIVETQTHQQIHTLIGTYVKVGTHTSTK